jgi:hypothetical protein
MDRCIYLLEQVNIFCNQGLNKSKIIIKSSLSDFQISTELVAVSSLSSSTAASKRLHQLLLSWPGILVISLGADPTENTVFIVAAQ